MAQNTSVTYSEPESQSAAQIVHNLLRFACTVQYRKHILYASLFISILLGGLYYATATRYYVATTSLLVMQNSESLSPTLQKSGSSSGVTMSTFVNIVTSAKVIEGANKYLKPEDCIDSKGDGILTTNLSVKAARFSNILEISYCSKDPTAAKNVVSAVLQSYIDFLDNTHKGGASEVIRVLNHEKTELAEKLTTKENELLAARLKVRDLGVRGDNKVLHPDIQRAVSFNNELIAVQQEKVRLKAAMASLESSIRNGEDLQQHIMALASFVGKEILLDNLGFSKNATVFVAMERSLIEERASLKKLEEHFGPKHPSVVAQVEKIRMTEAYLTGYQDRINRRLSDLRDEQLGPMLAQMVRQRIDEAQQREAVLVAEFEQARDKAVGINSDLTKLEIIEHDLKWLRNLHDVLLEQIASIDLRQDSQGIQTAVLEEPRCTGIPISPQLKRTALLSIFAGVAVGLILIYVIDTLDDRFRSLQELEAQLRVNVLSIIGQLPVDEELGVENLQMVTSPNSAESEPFRTLRTALELTDKDARQIVISSAEPGDGKTTVIANLAVAYAQASKRTLLIDADLRRPGLTAMLNMRGIEGLSGIIQGSDDVIKMAASNIRATPVENLDVLAAGPRPSNPTELLASPRFSALLAWAESIYDQVLIDSPPVLVTSDAMIIGRLMDGVILAVQPDKNQRQAVIRAIQSFNELNIASLGVVVSRLESKNKSYYGYSYGGYGYGGYGSKDSSYGHDDEVDSFLINENGSVVENEEDPFCPDHNPQEIIPRKVA